MEKTKCPTCGAEVEEPIKEWKIKGRVQGKKQTEFHPTKRNVVLIQLFRCSNCNRKFRKGTPIKEDS